MGASVDGSQSDFTICVNAFVEKFKNVMENPVTTALSITTTKLDQAKQV